MNVWGLDVLTVLMDAVRQHVVTTTRGDGLLLCSEVAAIIGIETAEVEKLRRLGVGPRVVEIQRNEGKAQLFRWPAGNLRLWIMSGKAANELSEIGCQPRRTQLESLKALAGFATRRHTRANQ